MTKTHKPTTKPGPRDDGSHSHEELHDFGSNQLNLAQMHSAPAEGEGEPVQQEGFFSWLFGPSNVDHLTGAEVDTMVQASPFISAYVADKFDVSGNGANGNVTVLNAAEFREAWVRYAMTRRNPATNRKHTQAEALLEEPTVNAFQGDGKITLHENRGEASTNIHESIHLFASPELGREIGFNGNEGATEHFTRMICEEQGIKRGGFYGPQRRCIDSLASQVGENCLADAFFRGNTIGLKVAVNRGTNSDSGDGDSAMGELAGPISDYFSNFFDEASAALNHTQTPWDQWVQFMQAGAWTEANAIF